jgi:molybdopterin molybdotransferase
MLSVAEAQARIWAAFTPGPEEWVSLPGALGRVLAQDLAARRDQPPLAVSAMDGYAVRAADTVDPQCRLEVVGEIPAGTVWPGELRPGQALRIFTGAPLPAGADAVLIQEDAEAVAGGVRCREPVEPGRFVRPQGLDFKAGWIGLPSGRVLDPRALGLAAAMGHAWLPVRRRPRVGLLATGDELRWPGETPGPGQIIASNSVALAAMVRAWGGAPVDLGICPDRADALADALGGVAGLDLLVTTGGASVGDYDLVRGALAAAGLELDFWKIAMRPGKPLAFGRLGPTPVLGLPGNPVSALVCGIVFLRGALRRRLGLAPELRLETARLAAALPANDQRQDHLRAGLEPGADGVPWALPAARQDRSMLATLAAADALIVRPPLAGPLPRGAPVPMIRLDGIFCGGPAV